MKNSLPLFSLVGALVLFGAGCTKVSPAAPTPVPTAPAPEAAAPTSVLDSLPTEDMNGNKLPLAFPGVVPAAEVTKKVRIKTSKGDIVIQVDPQMGANAASNFVYLVKQKFYDGTIFHRVIPGFMIQGGDPTGTGMGGPGYKFANDPVKGPYADGVVAMANAGVDTNGSQFFIMVADYPLPPSYSQFGKVIEGLDIAHQIAGVARNSQDRPNEEVKMIEVKVE